jgi:hypothetical protein
MLRRTAAALIAVLGLAACSGTAPAGTAGDSSATANTVDTIVDTTVVTSTTEPQLSTADEPAVECDNSMFRDALGEKMRMLQCTENWASGNSDRDTWNCPDEGCRQVRLYARENGTWRSTAVCDTRYPLTLWKVACYRTDLQPLTVADVPSPAIQCRIWPANVALRNVSETGCTPPASVIAEATRGNCTRWVENFALPIEKCDSGRVVRTVQKRLAALGFETDVDGYLGPGGVTAVMAFQEKNSLLATGLVDLATWRALFPGNAGLKGTDTDGDGVITPDELS